MNSSEPKLCQGKDVFERMNYLYQASRFISGNSKVAASYYGNIMLGCAKKSVLRMEPDVKRTICKSCQSPLIPGETARIRLVSKPVKAIKWTCLVCKMTRRIPSRNSNKLWINEPESLVQMYDYTPKGTNALSKNSSNKELTGKSYPRECNVLDETKPQHFVVKEGS